ncbi:hypothetical protein BpHYR1_030175 [Brachionus plicatilis]|uniref:Uncharacterized protein n=1 Tax=Brachionus plicatilis TaxID=10195 RepID=A0A3M7RG86_BRAPC|nr:hypothetical protein BpHYR1_030175 [Brachionus plicatilis]
MSRNAMNELSFIPLNNAFKIIYLIFSSIFLIFWLINFILEGTGFKDFYLQNEEEYYWKNYKNLILTNKGIIWLVLTTFLENNLKNHQDNQFRKIAICLWSVFILSNFVSFKLIAVLYSYQILFFVVSKFIRSKFIIWTLYFLLTTLFEKKNFSKFVELNSGQFDFMYIVYMTDSFLKIISFCSDKIDSNNQQMNFTNYFYYLNHPTFLFPGLFVPFKNFIQIDQPNKFKDKKKILFLSIKVVLYGIIIEFFARFTSIFSMFDSIDDSFETFSTFTMLVAIPIRCTLSGLISYNTFGMANIFHMLNGVETTELPRCAFFISSFSEMWRNWNSGVHLFIKNYVYAPLGGKKRSKIEYIMSLTASFIFSAYYHGFSSEFIFWAFINIIVMYIESFLFNQLFNNEWFSKKNSHQKRAIASVLLGLSQINCFYFQFLFICHKDIVFHFINILMVKSSYLVSLITLTYCFQQIRFEKYDFYY